MRVFDDNFNEADEEIFIIVLTVDNSSLVADTNTARLQRQSSLCIIQDNDGKSSSVMETMSIDYCRYSYWVPRCIIHLH